MSIFKLSVYINFKKGVICEKNNMLLCLCIVVFMSCAQGTIKPQSDSVNLKNQAMML